MRLADHPGYIAKTVVSTASECGVMLSTSQSSSSSTTPDAHAPLALTPPLRKEPNKAQIQAQALLDAAKFGNLNTLRQRKSFQDIDIDPRNKVREPAPHRQYFQD